MRELRQQGKEVIKPMWQYLDHLNLGDEYMGLNFTSVLCMFEIFISFSILKR